MKKIALFAFISFLVSSSVYAQNMVTAAKGFINSLTKEQQAKAIYPFDIDERYNFHFFPIEDRKGISFNELSEQQQKAAFDLLKTCLSESSMKKVKQIMQMEVLLKAIEKRKPEDHFRDPGKYNVTIFGIPGDSTIWGWRFEGHHVCYNFSANKKELVGGTPGFFGANPGIVLDGPSKGLEVLKDETNEGFELLHALTGTQLKSALIDSVAPKEIITFTNRKAMIEHPAGISYTEMTVKQQQQFLQLIRLYVNRYTKIFADDMLKEIQQAGLDNIKFAWAGSQQKVFGNPYYYRIQGPTIIIEYDNTQNNANHVHTIVRDLKNDFGGDLLLQHYKESHQSK